MTATVRDPARENDETSATSRFRDRRSLALGGGVVALLMAVALYTRFSLHGVLTRDQSIYAYGGQRLGHAGVAPYASIFDPKTPLGTFLSGIGAALAGLLGRSDLSMIRLVFMACACLSVVALYALVTSLWRSPLGGLVAAAVFVSFFGYAQEALAGPDPKTAGVLALLVCLWLALQRRWLWSGVAAGIAFLAWQPFVAYAVVLVVVAGVWGSERAERAERSQPAGQAGRAEQTERGDGAAAADARAAGRRWSWDAVRQAVIGAAAPVVIVLIYFAVAGAFSDFVASALAYPATGVIRPPETFSGHVRHIISVVRAGYHYGAPLIWIGLLLLLAVVVVHLVVRGRARRDGRSFGLAVADPLVSLVAVTGVLQLAYALYDFQGVPDVFPFLPYAAIGFGGAVAVLMRALRHPRLGALSRVPWLSWGVGAVAALAAVALLSLSWTRFSADRPGNRGLRPQLADACAVQRLVPQHRVVWSLGSPVPLVLTHRVNPDKFVYLNAGVDRWKVAHTKGGFAGWTHQILAAHPDLIVLDGWTGGVEPRMERWLHTTGYRPGWLGGWQVFLSPAASARVRTSDVRLTRRPTSFAADREGHILPAHSCHPRA